MITSIIQHGTFFFSNIHNSYFSYYPETELEYAIWRLGFTAKSAGLQFGHLFDP